MKYTLKLVKVAGETRWAVHNGRKIVSKLYESYASAVHERLKTEQRDRLAEPASSLPADSA